MDMLSIMVEALDAPSATNLNQRIAERVRELRAARGLSLDQLAAKSGVSRSMISLVERGESSPTAVVLEKLSVGLGVVLASLFDPLAADREASGPVARRADQPDWRDPESGYRRRNVSPPNTGQPMQIVEIEFPAGARVTFDNSWPDLRVHQQVWVIDGTIEIAIGRDRYRLKSGDCLAMLADRPTTFHNPTRKTTRYAVVIASAPVVRR